MSNFKSVPMVRFKRSKFNLGHKTSTSGNVGRLYPFECQEVYPGDTFKVKTGVVSRLTSTFLKPIVDNLFMDVYWFFVPSRLVYDKFKNVFGENTSSPWANSQEYSCPSMNGVTIPEKSVGDYLGLPTKQTLYDVNILPFRGFGLIYDSFFRDENVISPMHIQTGDKVSSESPNSNEWSPSNYMGLPPKVAKFHDYFTSCLPSPQKGDPVDISVGGVVPVKSFSQDFNDINLSPVHLLTTMGAPATGGNSLGVGGTGGNVYLAQGQSGTGSGTPLQFFSSGGVVPSNLGVDLSATNPLSVNDLRFAFQYQKMLERDARGGSRYIEYLYSHFGVSAGDYRLQRPEFLGGKRVPLNIVQVTQSTGANSADSPLGLVGAYSHTASDNRFTKSFVEHGYVYGVYCIRQNHTYQQGMERFWNRVKRTDFYDPVFANIGEQPVYKSELYGAARTSSANPVFGYNEAWADLRSRPNKITGQLRSNATNPLDMWHLGDNYVNAPTLSADFINETPDYLNRVITVDSSKEDQFLVDFYVNNIAYRTLPVYSVPSLIDHN